MNKKSILLILLSTLALGANAQRKYTIKSHLQNAEGQKIYLYSGDLGNMDIDSTIIANGKFTLKGELDTPFKCGNLILGNPKDYLNAKSWQIALEPTTITITGDANKQDAVSIKGCKVQDDHNKIKEERESFQKPLTELNKQYNDSDRELGMQEAMLNRLEGSVSYAISQIEERYGTYEEFECDDPDVYVKNNTVITRELEDGIKKEAAAGKKLENELKDIQVCRKDIERIMSGAGINIPDEEILKKTDIKYQDYNNLNKEYEQTAKEYSAILKLEYKKTDEFVKYKSKLIDSLKSYNAEDLAVQISMSVNMPKDEQQTSALIASLDETNSYIELEKTRVHKGIEDMERIKDNFENRCIQTCSNIRTELERLPKLSHIKMDKEDISIIGLNIPYVKESVYKERMSEYIDETIEAAESFKDTEERFRYIRNRLTWKRLFSVIVTDMNSIRINLYKRERIKDQSRYLRYEEAVGSTGQSQGIYIQFLIAIINYISNINTVMDGGIVGNTIFIDNPFGAAKDIYIWEPIFKLLKANHIQLIVPARGATPAITARFDVNYILGQKMADNRQQTVVVDYYSNVKQQELEYTRMNYEQASFDFL